LSERSLTIVMFLIPPFSNFPFVRSSTQLRVTKW
jgi:hypothetical protein